MHDQQEDKQDDLAKPHAEEGMYVSLPGHPLCGQRVRVTKYERAAKAHFCLIQDPLHPDFQYQIKATWLSDSPPLFVSSEELRRSAVALAVVALDRMVQRVLVHRPEWRIEQDEQSVQSGSRPDLGTAAGARAAEIVRTAILPGPETGRRHTP